MMELGRYIMDENKNEKLNGYTGEYGNSVEGGTHPQDGTYSYSYKEDDNAATHSGDYYANSTQSNYSVQNNTQQNGYN